MKREMVIEKIKEALRNLPYRVETIVFGSEARGDARMDSDIDLLMLIDMEKVVYKDEEKIFSFLYPIELMYGISINPIIVPKAKWNARKTPLHENIEKEGIRL